MATRKQLPELALLRLKEAEVLYAAGLFEGCVYLCGYVVELALKASICASPSLGLSEYPEKGSRLREAMKSHILDDLSLVEGMPHEFTSNRPDLLTNWSAVIEWKPEWR